MRANPISLSNIATTLAALGTSAVIAACGGDTPKSNTPSTDPSAASGAASGATAAPSAAPSGASNTAAPAGGAAETKGKDVAAQPAPSASAAAAMPTPSASAKPVAKKASPHKASGTGQASCGAGTCSSDAKKK